MHPDEQNHDRRLDGIPHSILQGNRPGDPDCLAKALAATSDFIQPLQTSGFFTED
jgi:hypothetical protein